MIIKRIKPLSLAKFLGIFFAAYGVVAALIVVLISLYSYGLSAWVTITSFLYLPIIYAVVAFLSGYIFAVAYNIICKRVGGIEIDAE